MAIKVACSKSTEEKPGMLRRALFVLIMLSLAGVAIVLLITKPGVGVNGDAVWYLQGAQNILSGHGYSIERGDGFLPITMFPPFYSILLALLGASGIPISDIARILNAALFGYTVFLSGWLIYRLSKEVWAGIVGSAIIVLFRDLIFVHAWALTEPLYIALTLTCLAITALYLQSSRERYLAIASLFAGLAVITRYVGLSLVASLCVWSLGFDHKSWNQRLRNTIMAGVIGFLPLAGWMMRNRLLGLTAVGRSGVVLHQPPLETLKAFPDTIWNWFVPGAIHVRFVYRFLLVAGGLVLLGMVIVIVLKKDKDKAFFLLRSQIILMIIYMFTYVFTVLASIALALAGSPFSWQATGVARYLTPLFPWFIMLISILGARWRGLVRKYGQFVRYLPMVPAAVLIAFYSLRLISVLSQPVSLGYTDIKTSRPDLVVTLQDIASKRPIVTNNYEMIYFLVGRPVYSIPGPTDELTGMKNPVHDALMSRVKAVVDEGAAVVIFRPPGEEYFFDSWLNQLKIYKDFGDFKIYLAETY